MYESLIYDIFTIHNVQCIEYINIPALTHELTPHIDYVIEFIVSVVTDDNYPNNVIIAPNEHNKRCDDINLELLNLASLFASCYLSKHNLCDIDEQFDCKEYDGYYFWNVRCP